MIKKLFLLVVFLLVPLVSQGQGTGQFRVSGGKVYDPNGALYIAKGLNVYSSQLGNFQAVELPQSSSIFPGLNHVRIPVYPTNPGTASAVYPTPSSFLSYVEALTGYNYNGSTWTPNSPTGIVLEFEDHNQDDTTFGSLQPYTGTALTIQENWYTAMASYFNGNPYVWLGGPNEMATAGTFAPSAVAALSTWEGQIYSAIRAGSSSVMIQFMAGVGGSDISTVGLGSGFDPSVYAPMTNVIWEIHCYYNDNQVVSNPNTGYVAASTAAQYVVGQAANSALDNGFGGSGGFGIVGAQTIESADGVMPVIIGEWGSGTGDYTGSDADQLAAEVIAVQSQYGVGATAWGWFPDGANDTQWAMVNNGDGGGTVTLTGYGTVVAATFTTTTPSISINSIATVQQNTPFTVAGGLSDFSSAPPLQYENNNGGWNNLPNGNTVSTTAFSFTDPGLPAGGANTVSIRVSTSPSTVATSNSFVSQGPASPNNTIILAGTSNTITDSSGNVWGISSGGQVIMNGVTDTLTSGVVEMAYVNSVVWQENGSALWWYWSPSTSSWLPTTGTTTSPVGGPAIAAPATLSVSLATATPVTGVNMTDTTNPNDTMTGTITATNHGTLTATGATGNGTGSLSFSGSLSAVNALLSTLTFKDTIDETSTIAYSITDAHSLNGQATTVATVSGCQPSPNNTEIFAGSGLSITSESCAIWTITAGGQVAINGVTNTHTNGVSAIAIVSGIMWADNTGFIGPGDIDPAAQAFYGIRGYSAAYSSGSNPCCIVERSTDGTTAIINILSNGKLDVSTLNTFLTGGANGYVVTFYDQTGNNQTGTSYVLTPSTGNGAAPQILASGGPNGTPTLVWSGTNSPETQFQATLAANLPQPWSFASVGERNGDFTNYTELFGLAANATLVWTPTANQISDSSEYGLAVDATAQDNQFNSLLGVLNGTSSQMIVNGSVTTGNGGTTSPASGNIIYLGENPGANSSNGYFSETGIWQGGFTTTQVAGITANEEDYYGLATPAGTWYSYTDTGTYSSGPLASPVTSRKGHPFFMLQE